MRKDFKKGGSPAWTRKEGKSESGGLNQKGVDSYRRANPGSKLKTAVTTKPSKLKKGSKAAKRRKSFCARMKGMRKRQKPSNNTGDDRVAVQEDRPIDDSIIVLMKMSVTGLIGVIGGYIGGSK
jgi:hypothetical protein